MLGDIVPAAVKVSDLGSAVYAARDNVTVLQFTTYAAAKRKDVPLDFSAVDRMVLVLPEADVAFDSDVQTDAIDWSLGNGCVRLNLADYAIEPGVYAAQLLAFDAEHLRGQVIVSGEETEKDLALTFSCVDGSGELPPPFVEWVPEAPVDGVLRGRRDKRWVELTPANIGAATAAQGDLAASAVQPADIADVVRDDDTRLTDSRTPTGGAGGVLSGSYPNPGFAVDMATQQELEDGLATRMPASSRGAANGVASLGADGKILESELPAIAITDTFSVASQAAMLALTAERGDIAIRTDLNKTFALAAEPASTLANWLELRTPTDAVLSVAGKTGAVTLVKGDVGLGNVDNTSDADKPVSTATATALAGKLDATATAADSSKLGGQSASYYAKAADVDGAADALDLVIAALEDILGEP